jgi:hypothetical protein
MYANLRVFSRVFESVVVGARIDNQQLGVENAVTSEQPGKHVLKQLAAVLRQNYN